MQLRISSASSLEAQPRARAPCCSLPATAPHTTRSRRKQYYLHSSSTPLRTLPQPLCPIGVGTAAAAGFSPLQPLEDASRPNLVPADIPFREDDFVEVGKVTGAFGIAGELRVEISTDNPRKRFRKGAKLFLQPPRPKGLLLQASPQAPPIYQISVLSSKVRILPKSQQVWILKFPEVPSRTAAEQLLGYRIIIPAMQREKLKDPDEFWAQDLVGCSVLMQESRESIGTVVDVISGTGKHDTLVVQLNLTAQDIQSSSTRRCMVPFVKVMCPEVDLQTRTIHIAPPEGLLDLASKKAMGRKLKPEQQEAMLAELRAGRQPSLARARAAERQSDASASTSSSPSSSTPSSMGPGQRFAFGDEEVDGEGSEGSDGESSFKTREASPQVGAASSSSWGDEDGGDEDGSDDGSGASRGGGQQQGANERWRLRRAMGASFATRKPSSAVSRRLRLRKSRSRSRSVESDGDN